MKSERRVLVACGTAIATATVVAEKVKEIAKEAGIPVRVVQCKAAEVRGRISTFNPHAISGVPFLSGVGMDELKAQILEALKS
jgi:PTS system galactitol-specific IIB component